MYRGVHAGMCVGLHGCGCARGFVEVHRGVQVAVPGELYIGACVHGGVSVWVCVGLCLGESAWECAWEYV